MRNVRVMTELNHFPYGDYLSHGIIGEVVVIPVLHKKYLGVIIETDVISPFQLRIAESTGFYLKHNYMRFLQDFSLHNITYPALILKTILSLFSKRVKLSAHATEINYPKLELNGEQSLALDIFRSYTHGTFLLYGVTGSGKTETFFQMAIDILKQGKQVLLILPEIVLGVAIKERFTKLFGWEPVIWNSTCKNKQKFMDIYTSKAKFIIGTRCSIFLPYGNLGLIILDEEHDKIHQQTQGIQYNCRDSVVLLGQIYNISVILVSATPSLESYYQAQEGKYILLRLQNRFKGALPSVKPLHTMDILPEYTIDKCREVFSRKKQVIFFLNRRGFANYITCVNCYAHINCETCQTNMVWHKSQDIFLCHRCNKIAKYDICPKCHHPNSLACRGYGVEKVNFLLSRHFPDKKIITLSSDTYKPDQIKQFIDDMHSGVIDAIVGTQLVTKGLDFGNVALVVVVNFNKTGFDFRLWENTFQTLLQISGRAGRDSTPGEVIVQTHSRTPLGPYITSLDYESFMKEELLTRKSFQLPPFVKIIGFTGDVSELPKLLAPLGEVLTNSINILYLKISFANYLQKISTIRSILKQQRDKNKAINIQIDPIDILY